MSLKEYRRFPTYDRWWTCTDEQRISIYRARWDQIYRETPWGELSVEDKRAIIKCRLPRPDTCPRCGKKRFAYLWSIDDHYADDNSNWYYSCRECRSLLTRSGMDGPGCSSSWFARLCWSSLSHQGKVRRVKEFLPRPDTCPRCDVTRLQIVSWSGQWLDNPLDYVWMCRVHANQHYRLLNIAAGPAKPEQS